MSDQSHDEQQYEGSYNFMPRVDWGPIYRDLDLLKSVSELRHKMSRSEEATLLRQIKQQIEEGANIDGITDYSFPVDPELDEIYDGVDELMAETPLTLAIIARNVEAIKLLLKMGADVNTSNGEGATPLELAIEQTDLGLVDLLISHGATLDDPMEHIRRLLMVIKKR